MKKLYTKEAVLGSVGGEISMKLEAALGELAAKYPGFSVLEMELMAIQTIMSFFARERIHNRCDGFDPHVTRFAEKRS